MPWCKLVPTCLWRMPWNISNGSFVIICSCCMSCDVLQRNFQGSCILFAQLLDWRPAIIWPWTETACDFVLYLNIAVNVFYATFMGFATLLIAYKCDKKYAHKIGWWFQMFISDVFRVNSFIIFLIIYLRPNFAPGGKFGLICIGYNTVWSELCECFKASERRRVFIEAWLLVWLARLIYQRICRTLCTLTPYKLSAVSYVNSLQTQC